MQEKQTSATPEYYKVITQALKEREGREKEEGPNSLTAMLKDMQAITVKHMKLEGIPVPGEKSEESEQEKSSISASSSSSSSVEEEGESEEEYNLLGLIANTQGKFEGAADYFKKVTKINPFNAGPYVNLGTTRRIQGKPEEAIKLFSQAISLAPKFSDSYLNLGLLYESQKNYLEAMKNFLIVKALTPDPKLDEAIETCLTEHNKSLDLSSSMSSSSSSSSPADVVVSRHKRIEMMVNNASISETRGRFESAIYLYNFAISLDPKFKPTYIALASLYYKQTNYLEALKNCLIVKALNLAPDPELDEDIETCLAEHNKSLDLSNSISSSSSSSLPAGVVMPQGTSIALKYSNNLPLPETVKLGEEFEKFLPAGSKRKSEIPHGLSDKYTKNNNQSVSSSERS
jgi:tetratricopeptide (TPR) repeat protein